ATDPRAVIETKSQITFEVGETERNHSPGKRDYTCACDYAQNSEQGTLRDLTRHRRRGGLRDSDWGYGNGRRGHHSSHQRRVRTVTTAESPGRNSDASCEFSSTILTGTLCVTLVKFPVALSGGSNANCEPLAGAISSTLPLKTLSG